MRAYTLLSLMVGGCAIQTQDDRVGYVLLDESARNAGLGVERGGAFEAFVPPLAILGGETIRVVDANGRERPLDVEPGEVVLVRGAQGYVNRWPFGTARPDVLLARTVDEQAAVALGEAIDADVLRRDAGSFELLGPAVWENAAMFAEIPQVITELLPLVGDDETVPEATDATALFADAMDPATDTTHAIDIPRQPSLSVAAMLDRLLASGSGLGAFGAAAAGAFQFSAPNLGTYAVSIRSTFSGGCSRMWTNGTAHAVTVLHLETGGAATACRSASTRSVSMSMWIDDNDLTRGERSNVHEDQQQGYRGRWQRDGAELALALVADDTVCTRVFRGSTPPAPTLAMSCAAVRSRGELALPSGGIACTVGTETYDYSGHSLDGLAGDSSAQVTLLGHGFGWEITTAASRWERDTGLTVRPATARIDPTSVIDQPTPF